MYKEILKRLNAELIDHHGRLIHCLGVEKKSIELAAHYKLDVEKCAIIALLHDIAKKMDINDQLEIIKNSKYEVPEFEGLYHGYVARIIAENDFSINDEDILDAVAYHTTGYKNPSMYAKVLMVADITEESTRTYQSSKLVRELEYVDLDKALELKLEIIIKELTPKGYEPSVNTLECLKSLRGEL